MKLVLILILGCLTLFFVAVLVSDTLWPVGFAPWVESAAITLCLAAALVWVARHSAEDAMKKWWVVLLALFFLRVFHSVDQASQRSTAVAAPRPQTAIMIFRPWTAATLRHGFMVSRKVAGSCWAHSLSMDRPDAWRCMVGNDIYDPCFAGPAYSKLLACAESPFSKSVVLLNLTKPLSDGESSTTALLQPKGEPWGLRLTTGDTCVLVTGATDAVAGERLNYACAKKGWIIGAPHRSTVTWSARSVDWPKRQVRQVGIAAAVF